MTTTTAPHIVFRSVTKEYHLQKERTFKDFLPSLLQGGSWSNLLTVFSGLSLDIRTGETVGIIGKNGAGKSTLMKLIAGVTYPTKGTVTVMGRVAPLIELGAGFHHELSGHENIFLNGAILGMHKKEIELVYDEIVAFSELEEFIHTPIKRYSTGMLMRLAFSIAVHTRADIYLIDEVLAVGDVRFQKKCLKKLEELKADKGKIIVFISHDKTAVSQFCERVIYLGNGKLLYDGSAKQAFNLYEKTLKKPDVY
jgi:ABC-type polysaccharide/polyol phosphate transport system ATPase subunit